MRSPLIGRLNSDREASLAHAATAEARALSIQARGELKELSELRTAREESDKRLEDNKQIVTTLAELLPPYVDKVRDVHADFEEFDKGFPKLEEAVRIYHARSRKTSNDIDGLRKQVGTLTQQHEAFLRLSKIAPFLLFLAVAAVVYVVQR